jgi:hypothetical protein
MAHRTVYVVSFIIHRYKQNIKNFCTPLLDTPNIFIIIIPYIGKIELTSSTYVIGADITSWYEQYLVF